MAGSCWTVNIFKRENMDNFLSIDGSILEGGGQILRIALGLSCLLNVPVRVKKIRAGRQKPGLAAQHLNGVHLLQTMCNAKVTGAFIGSQELEFEPNLMCCGKFYVDTQTAGSIALLLQVALPVALLGNGSTVFDLKGGTNAPMAPQIDFITEIFRPNLEKFGATFDFELFKRGYFPKGGGHCEVVVHPVKRIEPVVNIDFGNVKRYFGWCFAAGTLPIQLAVGMAVGVRAELLNYKNVLINLQTYKERPDVADSNCSGLVIGCESTNGCILGGSALGARGEKVNETGAKPGREVVNCMKLKACVDSYVQDQIILYMGLASGKSRIRTVPLTLHTKTAIHVVEYMTKARYNIIESDDGSVIIECDGIGYINKYL